MSDDVRDDVRWAVRLPEMYEGGVWISNNNNGDQYGREWTRRALFYDKASALAVVWTWRAREAKAVLVRITRKKKD